MRKRLFILGALVICLINFLSAQITFQKTFEINYLDIGHSVKQTFDGGYIIGGGGSRLFLIKTDENGDTLWTKIFWGSITNCTVQGFSAEQTTDSGYIVIGIICTPLTVEREIYLIKTNSIGDTLWTRAYGDSSYNVGYSVHQTTDGGYILTGATSDSGGNTDVQLIKTDSYGYILWTKTFGQFGYDEAQCVRQTTDGGYIITGYSDISEVWGDVYLIKTDSLGNMLWSKTYGGTDTDVGYSVEQTTDGGYIICGETQSFGAGNDDVYLIKTDSIGDTLWTKCYGNANHDEGYQVQQTTDGGYVVIGSTHNPSLPHAFLIKTDANGDTLWTKSYRLTRCNGFSIQQTNDGGYIITGRSLDTVSNDNDIYLIKTDANGESGCYQENTPVFVTLPATQVTTPLTLVSTGVSLSTNSTVVGSGAVVTTICTTVGIKEIAGDKFLFISPNPSSGNFTISFEGPIMKGHVEILNILGVPVNIGIAENIFNESKKEIKLKNITEGIYFVKVFDGEKYYCKKVIIGQN